MEMKEENDWNKRLKHLKPKAEMIKNLPINFLECIVENDF